MSAVTERAAAAKRLKNDDTFQSVFDEIEKAKVKVFLDPVSSMEDREEAHVIIRALGEIKREIDARIANGAFEERKGQHRVND